MSDRTTPPESEPEPQALRQMGFCHDPATGHILLELDGHWVRLVSPQHLESLLSLLGEARSKMQPPIPASVPPPNPSIPSPPLDRLALATRDDIPATEGGAMLSVRSPFYGWQSMEMHPAFCRQLAHDLLGYAAALSPDVPPGTILN